MHLPRRSWFTLMLVGALLGTPALASGRAPGAHSRVDHPLPIQLATLPSRRRLRRTRRAKVRAIVWRTGRRMRAAGMIRARRETVPRRLPPQDSYARGPPRSWASSMPGGAADSFPASTAGVPGMRASGRAGGGAWVRRVRGSCSGTNDLLGSVD